MTISLMHLARAVALLAIAGLASSSATVAENGAEHNVALDTRAPRRHHHSSHRHHRRQYSTAQALAQFNTKSAAVTLSKTLAMHSWEYGTTSEALLEYYNPELSVFSKSAFPNGKLPVEQNPSYVKSLAFAEKHIDLTGDQLVDGDGAAGDPASLGVSAWLLGNAQSAKRKTVKKTTKKTHKKSKRAIFASDATSDEYAAAAQRQLNTLLYDTPRYGNGAISQRANVAELWADGQFMIHPFLAYSAVATNNVSLMEVAVEQCQHYRDVLVYQSGNTRRDINEMQVERRATPPYGVWEHIIGPQSQTRGLWATGNGWAALGIVRVLATVTHWSQSANWASQQAQLKGLLYEIFSGLSHVDFAPNGFYKNYVYGNVNDPTDTSATWFGDGSGSAALVAAALRYAVLDPSSASFLLKSTATPRRALAAAMAKSQNSTLAPTVDPYNWFATSPVYNGSPEAQAFLTMAISAWRDCVQSGVCSQSDF